MKKNCLLLMALFFGLLSFGQAKKKPASPAPVNPLKTHNDSLSYAVGLSLANFYKEQGIDAINTQVVDKAINDAMKKGTLLLNEQQCNNIIVSHIQKLKADKAAANKKVGEAFLADNKTKPGVVALPSGLQYTILKDGTGPKPTASDRVKCNYEGKLIDGTVFDSSEKQGKPIEFSVGGVIPGWTEALQLMPVGSKWRLFIPSNLAYGDQQPSPIIKAGSTLVFDVELLEIVK
ncbi:MAG: peptidylprolyl isomerase [Bacteroidetes bacterium]|nr:MAG: peptidylprolyl isomerase [Bacteroidota bacterium]